MSMLKFAIEKWDKNKDALQQHIENNLKSYNEYSYKDIVKDVVHVILNEGKKEYNSFEDVVYDCDKIVEIDHGDYQGTLLYIIPEKSWQPYLHQYLTTGTYYGSCSGCDTLQAIQIWYWDEEDVSENKKKSMIKDYMTLALHLIQNMRQPYSEEELN